MVNYFYMVNLNYPALLAYSCHFLNQAMMCNRIRMSCFLNVIFKYDIKISLQKTYAEQFDPLDFKMCGKGDARPGNFPFFTIIISITQIVIFAVYYAKDGSTINEFNR